MKLNSTYKGPSRLFRLENVWETLLGSLHRPSMKGFNSRAFFIKLNFDRFFNFFEITLVFIPFQSGLIFLLNRVSLVVFEIKIVVITPCYEIIVTFHFRGNGFDGCTTPEKGM